MTRIKMKVLKRAWNLLRLRWKRQTINEDSGIMKDDVNSIVGGVIISPDLNKLAPLKGKGVWKDQLKALLELIGSVASGNPVTTGAGISKFVLDELDIIENYKVSDFFRKFTAFAMEMTDVTVEEREKFANEIQEKANDFAGNVLMGMVDRLDYIQKEQVLASLIKARIHQFISVEDFFRLSSMLERIPYVDLEHLEKYQEGYYDESGDSELLYSTGVLQMASIDKDEGNKYVLSLLGEKLMMFGLQKPVKTKRTKGTSLPFSFEDVPGGNIESLFTEEGGKGRELVQKVIAESNLATKEDLEAQNRWEEYDADEEKITLRKGGKPLNDVATSPEDIAHVHRGEEMMKEATEHAHDGNLMQSIDCIMDALMEYKQCKSKVLYQTTVDGALKDLVSYFEYCKNNGGLRILNGKREKYESVLADLKSEYLKESQDYLAQADKKPEGYDEELAQKSIDEIFKV